MATSGVFDGKSRADLVEDVEAALGLVWEWGNVEGEHHVRWLVDQMLRALLGDLYEAWIERWQEDSETGEEAMYVEWDCGIPP